MKFVLLVHRNNGYTNVPQCYPTRTLPVLFKNNKTHAVKYPKALHCTITCPEAQQNGCRMVSVFFLGSSNYTQRDVMAIRYGAWWQNMNLCQCHCQGREIKEAKQAY